MGSDGMRWDRTGWDGTAWGCLSWVEFGGAPSYHPTAHHKRPCTRYYPMMDAVNLLGPKYAVFYIVVVLIGTYIIMNLFLVHTRRLR